MSVAAFAGLLWWKWGIVPVVLGAAMVGLIYQLAIAGW